jgi:thioredoxin-like negative regulator of GroEL
MYFKKTGILIFLFICSVAFSQAAKDNLAKENPVREITEENYHIFIDKTPFNLIYFYSSTNPDSLKMKKILGKLKIKNQPAVFAVNIDTNGGLRDTFQVQDLPSIVILQKKKLIYGIVGFIDDPGVLSRMINTGIEINLYE